MTADISTMTQAELRAIPSGPGRKMRRAATDEDRARLGPLILWVEWMEPEIYDETHREIGWVNIGGYPYAIVERADGSLYRM